MGVFFFLRVLFQIAPKFWRCTACRIWLARASIPSTWWIPTSATPKRSVRSKLINSHQPDADSLSYFLQFGSASCEANSNCRASWLVESRASRRCRRSPSSTTTCTRRRTRFACVRPRRSFRPLPSNRVRTSPSRKTRATRSPRWPSCAWDGRSSRTTLCPCYPKEMPSCSAGSSSELPRCNSRMHFDRHFLHVSVTAIRRKNHLVTRHSALFPFCLYFLPASESISTRLCPGCVHCPIPNYYPIFLRKHKEIASITLSNHKCYEPAHPCRWHSTYPASFAKEDSIHTNRFSYFYCLNISYSIKNV